MSKQLTISKFQLQCISCGIFNERVKFVSTNLQLNFSVCNICYGKALINNLIQNCLLYDYCMKKIKKTNSINNISNAKNKFGLDGRINIDILTFSSLTKKFKELEKCITSTPNAKFIYSKLKYPKTGYRIPTFHNYDGLYPSENCFSPYLLISNFMRDKNHTDKR